MVKRKQKINISNDNTLKENYDLNNIKNDIVNSSKKDINDNLQFDNCNVFITSIDNNKTCVTEDFVTKNITKTVSEEKLKSNNNDTNFLIRFIKYLKSYKSYINYKISKNKIIIFLKYYDYQLVKDIDSYIFQIDVDEIEFIKVGRAIPFYIKKIR